MGFLLAQTFFWRAGVTTDDFNLICFVERCHSGLLKTVAKSFCAFIVKLVIWEMFSGLNVFSFVY